MQLNFDNAMKLAAFKKTSPEEWRALKALVHEVYSVDKYGNLEWKTGTCNTKLVDMQSQEVYPALARIFGLTTRSLQKMCPYEVPAILVFIYEDEDDA